MPDLKRAAEAGSNMNVRLIWALIGIFVIIGISIGSGYMLLMALLTGGAMLGSKAMKGTQEKGRSNLSSYQSQEDIFDEKRIIPAANQSLPKTIEKSILISIN